jgi:ABC-type tungstate transport system substrate-binding protein
VQAAREFDAGVVEPPGPTEVVHLTDTVLRGVVVGDVPVAFERAAAFARVVAIGRVHLGGDPRSAARLVTTAEQLETTARLEREGLLS